MIADRGKNQFSLNLSGLNKEGTQGPKEGNSQVATAGQKGGKKFKGNEFAIPIYTPRTAYNFIRQNGLFGLTQMRCF